MKSALEKTIQWLNEYVDGCDEEQLNSLCALIKEQDRDTRHTCAEAVMSIDDIDRIKAHAACINARAV